MICKTCGSLLDGNSSVCDLCGTPIEKSDVQEIQPKTDIWPWDEKKGDSEDYADLFKEPIEATEEEKRRKFDFAWDSQEFHTSDYKKRDTVELRWDADAVEEMRNAPLNPFAASIGEAVRENEAAETDKKRTEESRNVFEDDIFDLRQSESEESKLRFSKKNEEFQELLDQEVEKIQRRQKEIDETRNRLESEDVMDAPVATPSVLTAGERIKSADERIAEFIARTDKEMLEAMRQRLNEDKEKEADVFTLDDVDLDVTPVDVDTPDSDTKKILPTEIEVDPTWFEVTTSDDAEIEEIPAPIDEVVAPTWYEVTTTVDEELEEAEEEEGNGSCDYAQDDVVEQDGDVEQGDVVAQDDDVAADSAFLVTGWASPFDTLSHSERSEAESQNPLSFENSVENEPPSDIPDFIYGDLPDNDPLPDYKPVNDEVKAPDFLDKPIAFPFDEVDAIADDTDTLDVNDAPDVIPAEAGISDDTEVTDISNAQVAGPGFVDFGASLFEDDDAKDEIADHTRNDAGESSEEVDPASSAGTDGEVESDTVESDTGDAVVSSDSDEEKPKTKVWLRNLINVLVVVAVLLIAFFSVMKLAPDSGAGTFLNDIWNSVFNSDSVDDDSDKTGDDALVPDVVDNNVPPIADKEALVASQLYYNAGIMEIVYDPEAKREQGTTYELTGANSATEIINDFWQKGTIGPVLFDEEAVACVIRYNSDLIKSTKGTSADILNDIALGSPEEAKLPDYLTGIGVLTINRLGIGDILTDGVYYYVWTSVEGVETIGGKDKQFTQKEVYQLSLDANVMKVYDHVVIK
jgi:hypothetical protein